MTQTRVFLAALAFCFVSGSALAQSTMYVSSPTAELKSGTTASAHVVAQLKRGATVTVKSTQGSWCEVTAGGQAGFIYRFKLTDKKPSGGEGLLASLGGGGATAREGSTAASIRGLSPTSEKYAGRAKIRPEHVKMVKHMESVQVSPAEVEKFLKTAKLGEFAQ